MFKECVVLNVDGRDVFNIDINFVVFVGYFECKSFYDFLCFFCFVGWDNFFGLFYEIGGES